MCHITGDKGCYWGDREKRDTRLGSEEPPCPLGPGWGSRARHEHSVTSSRCHSGGDGSCWPGYARETLRWPRAEP